MEKTQTNYNEKQMTYNPSKPVTIFNPLPQDQWPIKKGRKVVFISNTWSNWETLAEMKGTIRWFNPALETTCCTSKGHPYFTINIEIDRSDSVPADQVFPDTKAGRLALKKLKAEMYLDMAKSKRKESKKCLAESKALTAKAEEIQNAL